MNLKAFDLTDILYENNSSVDFDELKKRLKSYVLYFKKDDTIGICLKEQKKNILSVLKEYGALNVRGNFTNLDTFFASGDMDWDDIWIDEIAIEGNIAWREFSKIVEKNEKLLINSGDDFESIWYELQRTALKNILYKEIEKKRNELERDVKKALKQFTRFKGFYERKGLKD